MTLFGLPHAPSGSSNAPPEPPVANSGALCPIWASWGPIIACKYLIGASQRPIQAHLSSPWPHLSISRYHLSIPKPLPSLSRLLLSLSRAIFSLQRLHLSLWRLYPGYGNLDGGWMEIWMAQILPPNLLHLVPPLGLLPKKHSFKFEVYFKSRLVKKSLNPWYLCSWRTPSNHFLGFLYGFRLCNESIVCNTIVSVVKNWQKLLVKGQSVWPSYQILQLSESSGRKATYKFIPIQTAMVESKSLAVLFLKCQAFL